MKYVHLADFEELQEYNIKDTESTLRLFKYLATQFIWLKYDFEKDRDLYMYMAGLIVDAQIRGTKIDREPLQAYIEAIDREVAVIDNTLLTEFAEPIMQVRELLKQKAIAKLKKMKEIPLPEFNVTSKAHIQLLSVDVLGMARRVLVDAKDENGKLIFDPETNGPLKVVKWFKMNF
jgi:hypothetical protein